jgi:CRP-like cAMP-binding protein
MTVSIFHTLHRTAPSEQQALRDALSSDTLLAALPAGDIDWMITRGKVLRHQAGDRVHAKCAASDHLYRVLSGAVRISSASAAGRETILKYYGPGDWFGYIGLLDGGPRTHDIHACGPCVVFSLPRQAFEQLLARNPALYPPLTAMLCALIRETFSAIEDHALLTLSSRLAKHLITLADIYGVDHPAGRLIGLRLPQEDLSMLLGSSRQTVNRLLADWAKQGWIEVHYSQIVIVDHAALRHAGAISENDTNDTKGGTGAPLRGKMEGWDARTTGVHTLSS